jgi:hypothetical protein
MQKIINVIAVASGVVSLAVVGTVGYVYVNRDSIVDGVKQQVMDSVTGSLGDLGGLAGGVLGGGALVPEVGSGISGGVSGSAGLPSLPISSPF